MGIFPDSANSHNFLAVLHSGLGDEVPQHREGEGQDGLHEAGTVLGVSRLATETLALQVGDAGHDGLVLPHEVRQGGADAHALLAGPVCEGASQGTQTWGDSQHLDTTVCVLTSPRADVALNNEMIEYALRHVRVPHVQDVLAALQTQLGESCLSR